ncbi:hypothetical protein D0865_04104 [Hortaea werneckii]|uniref:Uncharacterized protein n=1 Tax=Hortaea werneckii TaxID=91943 RepID=A0A3M7CTV2_HORWE|nr:hypothetical protein D0865_04104 [Hortaea werneckii]
MADCGFLPLPVCIQCGTNRRTNTGLHCRGVHGSSSEVKGSYDGQIICWPAALLCCCCATDAGKRYVFLEKPAARMANKLVQE